MADEHHAQDPAGGPADTSAAPAALRPGGTVEKLDEEANKSAWDQQFGLRTFRFGHRRLQSAAANRPPGRGSAQGAPPVSKRPLTAEMVRPKPGPPMPRAMWDGRATYGAGMWQPTSGTQRGPVRGPPENLRASLQSQGAPRAVRPSNGLLGTSPRKTRRPHTASAVPSGVVGRGFRPEESIVARVGHPQAQASRQVSTEAHAGVLAETTHANLRPVSSYARKLTGGLDLTTFGKRDVAVIEKLHMQQREKRALLNRMSGGLPSLSQALVMGAVTDHLELKRRDVIRKREEEEVAREGKQGHEKIRMAYIMQPYAQPDEKSFEQATTLERYNKAILMLKDRVARRGRPGFLQLFDRHDRAGDHMMSKRRFKKVISDMNLGPVMSDEVVDMMWDEMKRQGRPSAGNDLVDYRTLTDLLRWDRIPYKEMGQKICTRRAAPDPFMPFGEPQVKTPYGSKADADAAVKAIRDQVMKQYGMLDKAFSDYDADKSGEISLPEFVEALSKVNKHMNLHLTSDEILELYKDADIDGDMSVNYKEFMAAFADKGGSGLFIPEFMKPKRYRSTTNHHPWCDLSDPTSLRGAADGGWPYQYLPRYDQPGGAPAARDQGQRPKWQKY
ncbi:unnamed protein product [Pedinophyceae sp. YPF-701]|nr:unnamed protein product [Pedinophyceae sp. YPF-701]